MKNYSGGISVEPGYCSRDSELFNLAAAFTLIFVFVYISTAWAEDEQDTGRPQLVVQEKTHDFGAAVEGENVVHDFAVQNRGSSVLEIQEVKTD